MIFTRAKFWSISPRCHATALSVASLLLLFLLAARPGTAGAEYRANELEVVDLVECTLKKEKPCKSSRVVTAMSLDLYVRTHGGQDRIAAILIATWMCYGDTSGYRNVCTRPLPRKPKFKEGDEVMISLKKHITDGWKGKVEVAYFQESVRSNVYGVRFADRKNVYARYFEKDLKKPAAPASPQDTPPQAAQPQATQPQTTQPQGAPSAEAQPGSAPQGAPPQ